MVAVCGGALTHHPRPFGCPSLRLTPSPRSRLPPPTSPSSSASSRSAHKRVFPSRTESNQALARRLAGAAVQQQSSYSALRFSATYLVFHRAEGRGLSLMRSGRRLMLFLSGRLWWLHC